MTSAAITARADEGQSWGSPSQVLVGFSTPISPLMKPGKSDKARWTFKLAPQLTRKAQQAYAAQSAEEVTRR